MKYMLLMFGPENAWQEASEEQREAVYAQFGAFEKRLEESGRTSEGYELEVAAKARTLRYRSDGHVVTDGPFAEAEEHLGGYYVLDCADEAEALEWAAQIPRFPGEIPGGVEVRPIIEHEG